MEINITEKFKPKVTVGFCIRNCAEFILEAINSVLEQDFPHEFLELIFVDESDDNTLEIIQEYLSKIDIPSKIFHFSRKGLGYSRNVVVDNAAGDFILWVDGDMTLSKDFIRKQLDFMEKHPNIGIARGKQKLEAVSNRLATLETFSRAAGRMLDYQSAKARSKALGTGGAIYRTEAIRQVGGFDKRIKKYGEDWDAEMRVRAAGWSLCIMDAEYSDYERHGLTWKNLWARYWRRGYDTHYFLHKNKGMLNHYRMFPPAAVISGFIHAKKLFRLTRQSVVFFLPLEHFFKMTAWYVGFVISHIDSYQPPDSSNMKSSP